MRPAPHARCSDRLFWALPLALHQAGFWGGASSSRPWLSFGLRVAPSRGGSLRVGQYIDPPRISRGLGVVVVVPVPPLVRRSLGVTLWRVLPTLLTAERREVEIAPGGPHCLVAAVVDEVGAEHLVAVADECIVAVPLVHAEVLVEAVGHGVSRHLPTHSYLQPLDVLLWCARGVGERGVAGVQMGQVCDLIRAQGATAAGVLGPAENPGLEEGAIDDQLPAALEQVEQANLTLGPFECVRLLDGHPRHPPALGGQRITGSHHGLLLHQQLLARSCPLLRRNDRWGFHWRTAFPAAFR